MNDFDLWYVLKTVSYIAVGSMLLILIVRCVDGPDRRLGGMTKDETGWHYVSGDKLN